MNFKPSDEYFYCTHSLLPVFLQDESGIDKETNTECIFIPERGNRGENKNLGVIKRSQTFSPSAAQHQYTCRVCSFQINIFSRLRT